MGFHKRFRQFSYFKIKIQVDEITKDVSLIITDFAEEDEVEEEEEENEDEKEEKEPVK